jgi:8-hydroxy-5-deazaflavin:NADPH oxidoreductase
MKLGILGGTMLAKTLGEKYLEAGLSVVFGVRSDFDTEAEDWKKLNRLYNRICPIESAIIQSEIILVCCENQCLAEICEVLKNVDQDGKLIIDCTNANYDKILANANTQMILKSAPNAVVFKAFNNLGIDYQRSAHSADNREIYFCGDGELEKIRIKRLIQVIGFRAVDAGDLDKAPLLEAFYHLSKEISWNRNKQPSFNFKLASA